MHASLISRVHGALKLLYSPVSFNLKWFMVSDAVPSSLLKNNKHFDLPQHKIFSRKVYDVYVHIRW
jgi:hypothetical protein